MDDTYLFIDARYLLARRREALEPVFPDVPDIDFEELRRLARATRIFYYDCLDDAQRANESEGDFNGRVQTQELKFEKIRERYAVHLRLGTLVGKRPRLRQKEVDVQLAVDMLTHGFAKNINKAILIAGDLDFRPIVEALVRNGVFVEVWYEPKTASKELFWAADFGRALEFQEFYEMSGGEFRRAHPLPVESSTAFTLGPAESALKRGQVGDKKIFLFRRGKLVFLYSPGWKNRQFYLECDDEELLVRYFNTFHGQIVWR
jgi:uncharacterized LabA/DUF88 family protein